MSWRPHIAELAKKLTRANGLLSKIRHYVDASTLRAIYYSLFHSHMTYAHLVWGLAGTSEINRIKKLQKQAVRIITFSDYSEPSLPLFSRLEILRFDDLLKLNMCLFMHEWYNQKLPKAFDKFFHFHRSNVGTRSSDVCKLSLPTKRTDKYGSSNIKYKGAALFNQHNELLLTFSKQKHAFKKAFTTLLLAAYT